MEKLPDPRFLSRRNFVKQSAATIIGASAAGAISTPGEASQPKTAKTSAISRSFDLHRAPDLVRAYTEKGVVQLSLAGADRWTGGAIEISTPVDSSGMEISLSAPTDAVSRLHFRWNGKERLSANTKFLGDAWERAYGDLAFCGIEPGRAMPWYFIASDGVVSSCYGVMTGPAAFCFWMVDEDGISLWADVRSGGSNVQLGARVLAVAKVVSRTSNASETPFETLHAFCRQMCPNPRLSTNPIYGHNDWDFFYGSQTAVSTLQIAHVVVGLSPTGPNRPYIVIDDGWEGDTDHAVTRGPWDHGNPKFPDMPGLASEIKTIGGRPGIWTRPTSAWDGLPDAWRLSRDRNTLDPTVDEAKQQITADITRIRQWGYELLKPDFLTVDILGRYGMNMGVDLTDDGWTFREGPIRTTAEVILDLYQTIRAAASDMVVIGCNTLSHLAAGVFEAARIGDDTSGTNWERTRKMGVNCLGFRSVQNRAFYDIDPDIAPITKDLPWDKSRQWLDLVSSSGAVLFTSLDLSVIGPEQQEALRTAFALAAQHKTLPLGAPQDWMSSSNPASWILNNRPAEFNWFLPEGATPFNV